MVEEVKLGEIISAEGAGDNVLVITVKVHEGGIETLKRELEEHGLSIFLTKEEDAASV